MPDLKTILQVLAGIFVLGILVFVYESVVRYPGTVALLIAAVGGLVYLYFYGKRLKNRV